MDGVFWQRNFAGGVPWENSSKQTERERFVKAVLAKEDHFTKLCQRYGVSRSSGYRALRRFGANGGAGLAEGVLGRKLGAVSARRSRWQAEVLAARKRHPSWGPKKLRWLLASEHLRAKLPSLRTLARLLKQAGRVKARKHRCRPGPQLSGPGRRLVRCCHDVWTVDFKGHFRVGDGAVCRPLTVRDLRSRYLLVCEHVEPPSEAAVRQVMKRCFARHGLPRRIRVDNGSPFAGGGALGLSSLSTWWLRLGIEVEFTRRGKPQDNGAHEQMHRVLKEETARPPACNLRQQAGRLRAFCRVYNEQRPHEALGQRVPAKLFGASPRRYAPPVKLVYPESWLTRQVSSGGYTKWAGRVRLIGRAFAHQRIGLKAKKSSASTAGLEVMEVYLGRQLLGQLHRHDLAGMRPARWKHPASAGPT